MFFLRCIFWLSIVYASMSWTSGALSNRDLAKGEAAAGAAATGAIDMASQGLSVLCRRHPADCIADAARLTALVDATAPTPSHAASEAIGPAAPIPLPVPDPRRQHARPKGLTPEP